MVLLWCASCVHVSCVHATLLPLALLSVVLGGAFLEHCLSVSKTRKLTNSRNSAFPHARSRAWASARARVCVCVCVRINKSILTPLPESSSKIKPCSLHVKCLCSRGACKLCVAEYTHPWNRYGAVFGCSYRLRREVSGSQNWLKGLTIYMGLRLYVHQLLVFKQDTTYLLKRKQRKHRLSPLWRDMC